MKDKNSFRQLLYVMLLPVLLLAGCGQGVNPSELPEAPNERLAFAIAEAMANPEVRKDVHEAMQSSSYQHYKLVLQDFLKSAEGAGLKKGMTDALGGKQQLQSLLSNFTEMDFYLSNELHRETWHHPVADLMVTAFTKESPKEVTAYHTSGKAVLLDSIQDMINTGAMLFVLHTAETKVRHGREEHNSLTIEKPEPGTKIKEQSRQRQMTAQDEAGYVYVTGVDIKFSDGGGNASEVFFYTYTDRDHTFETGDIHVKDGESRDGFDIKVSNKTFSDFKEHYPWIYVGEDDSPWYLNPNDYYGATDNITGSGRYEFLSDLADHKKWGTLTVDIH